MTTLELALRLAGIALLIAANGFFVAIEFAAIASRRTRVEHLASEGDRGARIVSAWLDTPAARDRLVAAAQVGITLASLALGALGESTFSLLIAPALAPLAERTGGFVHGFFLALTPVTAVVLLAVVHVAYGEQIPKVVVLRGPEDWAKRLAPLMDLFSRIARPFVAALDGLAGLTLRLFGIAKAGEAHRSLYTVEELKEIVTESEQSGVLEESERDMLHAVFDFGDTRVRQVMVPRTEMIAVAAGDPLPAVVRRAVETGLSKFPVYESAPDNIVGLIHVKDMLRGLSMGRPGASARELMHEPLFVPESLPIPELLHRFRAGRRHTAIVLDEYGGTSGMVTLEDVLEEITGDIDDAYAKVEPQILRRPDGSARVSGLVPIAAINETFGLRLRDDDYDTIAGYVLGRLGRIAQVGDAVDADGLTLRVDALDGLRIAYLTLSPPPAAAEEERPTP